jgi:hypothetical protein
MTMLTDGIKSKSLEEEVKQLDVAELLERACAVEVVPAGEMTPPPVDIPPTQEPPEAPQVTG